MHKKIYSYFASVIGILLVHCLTFFLITKTAEAAVLWSTSFESGSIDANLTSNGTAAGGMYNSGTWQANLSTDVAHTGNQSVKMTINTTSTNSNGIRLFRMQESRTKQPLYYSAWYYFPAYHDTPAYWWNILQFKSVNATHNDPFWLIDIIGRNGKLYPRLVYWPPNPDISYDQSIKSVPLNQWFHLEVYYVQSASGQGHITVWFDGTQIFDVANITTMFTDATESANWSVNNYTDKLSPATGTMYVDDMAVSTTRITDTPVLSPTPSGSGNTLALTLFLHGIGKGGDNVNPLSSGNAVPLHLQRLITVEATNADNQTITLQGTVTYQEVTGNFTGTVNNLPNGIYTVKIKSPQYLTKAIPGILTVTSGQTKQLPAVALTTGDANHDNFLSILDYNILLDCFSDLVPARNCSDTNKKLTADITDDGQVNQFDYNLFLRELSVQSGN